MEHRSVSSVIRPTTQFGRCVYLLSFAEADGALHCTRCVDIEIILLLVLSCEFIFHNFCD